MATTGSQTVGPGGGGDAVAHLGLFDFTGSFREKRLDAASYQQIAAHGWRFIDALPFWMHDDTCFAEKGSVDEEVTVDADTLRPYPFEPDAQLVIAEGRGRDAPDVRSTGNRAGR